MKKIKIIIILIAIMLVSCSRNYYERIYKKTYSIDEIIEINEEINNTTNPAKKSLYYQKYNRSLVKLDNITVKEVVSSQEVDYEFCVIADIEHEAGKIQCFIFSKNIRTLSRLENNKSRINVLGDFHRTYKIFDDYYLKIEIFESSISIENEEKDN